MALHFDIAQVQLNKDGEELCGDSVRRLDIPGGVIIAVSDGLGSGVKANILSSLTVTIATSMLEKGLPLEAVVEALSETLPVCRVRDLAYSTFSLLHLSPAGRAYLAEYDNPPAFVGCGDGLLEIARHERDIHGRTVKETVFEVADGTWVALVSDGVLHAGIGGVWNLGWGWERVGSHLARLAASGLDAADMARETAALVARLYAGRPGDDATVVIVRIRRPRLLTALIGPPRDRRDDAAATGELMDGPGWKVVCGGTTGNLVSRELGREIQVDLDFPDDGVPPTGRLEGIDLMTEGTLTLYRCLETLRAGRRVRDLEGRRDGASRLGALLLRADRLKLIVGRAINPAHQSPDVPPELAIKHQVVEDLVAHLRTLGKEVVVRHY